MIFSICILITAFFNQAFAKKEVVIGKNCHSNFFHLSVAIEAIEKISFSVDIFGKSRSRHFHSHSHDFFSHLARERNLLFSVNESITTDELFLFVYQQISIFPRIFPHVDIFTTFY